MKKFLGAIIVLTLVACESAPRNNHEAETNCQTPHNKPVSDAHECAKYTFNDFLITDSSVGPIHKEMTMEEVYALIPECQIKCIQTHGEFVEDTLVDVHLFDANGKLVLVLTPEKRDDLTSPIEEIVIKDKRFKSKEGIGLHTTFGELKRQYSLQNTLPDIDHIIIDVHPINTRFSIPKKELTDGWWNGEAIDTTKIPNRAKIDGMAVLW